MLITAIWFAGVVVWVAYYAALWSRYLKLRGISFPFTGTSERSDPAPQSAVLALKHRLVGVFLGGLLWAFLASPVMARLAQLLLHTVP
jgi:hypothetical protein